MNIQTHAARLALTERKLKKTDALDLLEKLYAETSDSDNGTKLYLARLYATLTPKPSVKNNPLAWVAQACSKQADQPAMQNIFVRDGYAIGLDGFRVHFYKVPFKEPFDSVKYDGKFIDCDFNILDLQNVKPIDASVIKYYKPEVLDMPHTQQIDLLDLFNCEVVALDGTRDMAYKINLFDTVYYFNKQFVDQIAQGVACLTVYAKQVGSEHAVWFSAGQNKTAVLMPVRMNSQ